MSTIEIFEPALCCNTGVCGDDVDQALVTFSADLDWVRSQGGDIARFNLASEPLAFAQTRTGHRFLKSPAPKDCRWCWSTGSPRRPAATPTAPSSRSTPGSPTAGSALTLPRSPTPGACCAGRSSSCC